MKNLRGVTFVIGAGAHVPYGLPSGADLLNDIKRMHFKYSLVVGKNHKQDETQLHYDAVSRLRSIIVPELIEKKIITEPTDGSYVESINEYVSNMANNFIHDLGESGVSSIDTFLSKYTGDNSSSDYENIGKYFIYKIIENYELNNPIAFNKQDWIHLLIKWFFETADQVEEFFENGPKFITFNYDNYLEKVFEGNLKRFHNFSDEKIKKLFTKLDIVHVYGDIGSFYNNEIEKSKYALKNIKVIGEDRKHVEHLSKIQKYLVDSDLIVFLGYGFHSKNNDLLFNFPGWKKIKDKKVLISTNINFKKYDQSLIDSDLVGYINFYPLKNEVSVDSYNMIQEGIEKFLNNNEFQDLSKGLDEDERYGF